MNNSYNSKELGNVGDGESPTKGLYCGKCTTWIPLFDELDEKTESRIKKLIREQRNVMAMRELQSLVGCNQRWAKIWVLHAGKPTPEYPGTPCLYCSKPLRTSMAKQCPHCFKSWHNED